MARNPKTSKKPVSKSPTKASAKKSTLSAKPTISKNDGDFQEVRTLIDLLKKNHLAVLEFEKGDLKIILKTPAGLLEERPSSTVPPNRSPLRLHWESPYPRQRTGHLPLNPQRAIIKRSLPRW